MGDLAFQSKWQCDRIAINTVSTYCINCYKSAGPDLPGVPQPEPVVATRFSDLNYVLYSRKSWDLINTVAVQLLKFMVSRDLCRDTRL